MNSKQNPHFRSSREVPDEAPELETLVEPLVEPPDPPELAALLATFDSLEAAEGVSGAVSLSMSTSSLFGGHVLALPRVGMPSPAAQPQYVARPGDPESWEVETHNATFAAS